MDIGLSQLEFQLFQKYINEKCGIEIPPEKAYLIESRLTKILVDLKLTSFGDLYNTIRNTSDDALISRIIDAITTNETQWFRDKTPWLILEDVFMPEFVRRIRGGERIRIWSAATSTGQEAYSTAICIDNYIKRKGLTDISLRDFDIIGTDISKHVLEIAKRGRYDSISIMRGLPKEYKESYFASENNAWQLDENITSAVTFRHFNLQNSFISLGKFDLIFLRYVLIYFASSLKADIVTRLGDCLKDSGALFMGAYEICSVKSILSPNTHEPSDGIYYTKTKEEVGL